ncbi:hypothetical protein HYPSUDRAFT_47678 [Hypholoma sublateritium FD-334 SS-4]|uniref:Yeast cell wall synthesis Kre9/Knh1-like N-terminal domain-containing protein n=1 Tax=Hypholoma sublateritium (strain FD-334 SS-4) TaxID=945553 RepID=A0A0D2P6W9_HYPSF|nr:hypothetical protein HYPSUDRAFT_47678 [Hypholoma sublateritium FD-334 SS-4]
MAGLVIVLSVLATFWCFSRPAAAAVYPTKPTATTIYQAGAPAEVLWIEDSKRPFLNITGLMQIDLYEGNSTYLATLAENVDPQSLSTTLYIPTSVIPRNYHSFTLHFVTAEPHQIIYTADFGIIPNAFSRSSSAIYSPSSQVVTVTSTITSVSTEMPQPSVSQKGGAGLGLRWALGGRNKPGGQLAIDADKMKFRVTFIVWPALVGLSMAL